MAAASATTELHNSGTTISTMKARRSPLALGGSTSEFAVIAGRSTLAAAAGKSSAGSIAVPTETLRGNNLSPTDGQIVIPPGTSRAAVSLIEKDVRIGGESQRQFRINRLLSDAEVARRLAVLGETANVAITSAPRRKHFRLSSFKAPEQLQVHSDELAVRCCEGNGSRKVQRCGSKAIEGWRSQARAGACGGYRAGARYSAKRGVRTCHVRRSSRDARSCFGAAAIFG